jgi:hypothetical protein
MSVREIKLDRREHKRFKIKDGTFAVLRSQPNSSQLGNIIDIGNGGLAFHFLDTKETPSEFSELDIFISGTGLLVSDVPVEIISQFPIEKKIPFFSVSTRRFCIKFGKLTDKIRSRVNFLIQNYSVADSLPDNPA